MANDYPVGYRKPPKGSRFTKGKSGNPNGRPKGAKNLGTYLSEELDEVITVREGGTVVKMTKGRALIKTLLARGLKGDARAAREIIVMDRLVNVTPEGEEEIALGTDDVEVVQTFFKSWTKSQTFPRKTKHPGTRTDPSSEQNEK